MLVAGVLLAAGTGTRFGGTIPKQFLSLLGRPVIRHAAEAMSRHVSLLQPVGASEPIAAALAVVAALAAVPGGPTRQASVRAGLEALSVYAPDVVLVHDAARPCVPPPLVPALLEQLKRAEGAIPAVPVTDTLKRAGAAGLVTATVPREGLFRAQTPQAFRFETLLRLHRAARGAAASDDAGLLEAAGIAVALVAGSEANVKLTHAADLARLERALVPAFVPRVGSGFDVHAFAAGRRLMVCGVEIPSEQGLAGHSDA
ncbi:MAG: 2-C-methyl-D-erythritol 4-phosphate cytidylyltransferase, partial [Acetobacteraceae bacterium]